MKIYHPPDKNGVIFAVCKDGSTITLREQDRCHGIVGDRRVEMSLYEACRLGKSIYHLKLQDYPSANVQSLMVGYSVLPSFQVTVDLRPYLAKLWPHQRKEAVAWLHKLHDPKVHSKLILEDGWILVSEIKANGIREELDARWKAPLSDEEFAEKYGDML